MGILGGKTPQDGQRLVLGAIVDKQHFIFGIHAPQDFCGLPVENGGGSFFIIAWDNQ